MTEERTLLARIDAVEIAEVRSPSGTLVEGEGFYVLAGELTFRLDDRELRAGPETWVYVPPAVARTVRVTGEDGAHFLDLRADDASGDVVLVRTGATAEAVEVSGNRIAYLADAKETGGAFGVLEFTAPPAFAGPPAHVHRGFHDLVFVLDGTIDARAGERSGTFGRGVFLHAPPGVPHTFSNPSDTPLRFLNFFVPGGFERFFRERAAATAAGAELTSRYDWERA